jgi:cytochrome P450
VTTEESASGTHSQHVADDVDVFALKNRVFGAGVVRDPYPHLAELAARCAVHRGGLSDKFGVAGVDTFLYPDVDEHVATFDWATADTVLKDGRTFSSAYYERSLRAVIGRTILEMDAPEHLRYRQLIQQAFTRKEMDRWEREFVRDIVDSYLDRMLERPAVGGAVRGDLVRDFIFHYPIHVMSTAAGLPAEHVPTFYRWAALITNVTVSEEQRKEASEGLATFLRAEIGARRAEPRDDLVSVLVQAELREPDGRRHRLTEDEIVAFLRLLIPAGAQTTYRALSNTLYGLLTHPDQLAAVDADRSLIPQAIEEGLRWEPPLIYVARLATEPVVVGSEPLGAGCPVNVIVGAANRDPSRWEHPEEFDIFRAPQPHLTFGTGPHVCLGIHFARMEMRVALELVLDRLRNLRLDPAADDVHITGLVQRAPESLPVLFDPA